MSSWRRHGLHEHVKLSVNVSRAQLHDPDFPERVRALLKSAGLPPSRLQLEVTESLAMDDDAMRSALSAIREAGVRLSLDDFGTGHSSLAALHRLPVNQVKIDRAFVSELASSAYHKAVVRACLDVAQTLGLDVVAEGVETAAQSKALMQLGCRWGQGWLFSKALEASEVPGFIGQLCVLDNPS
jgi:EAL domain-containing protein (putative c-di-GMP-specific phosphodiesterase class I)